LQSVIVPATHPHRHKACCQSAGLSLWPSEGDILSNGVSDPHGNAIAIWRQFEGGRPDDGSRSNIAINRFDRATGAWSSAVFAETQPGNAISPGASANAGQALLGWSQAEGAVNRVKALLQPVTSTRSQ
jgi:hypothetical protein